MTVFILLLLSVIDDYIHWKKCYEPIVLEELIDDSDHINQMDTRYLPFTQQDLYIYADEGTLYMLKNGEHKLLKKFYGHYCADNNGYRPMGLSPDGKYLVYYSMEHATWLGVMLDSGTTGQTYVMNLGTLETALYVYANNIQWVME